MTDFEAPEADALEQADRAAELAPDEVALEAPEADAVEQRTLIREPAEAGPGPTRATPAEADAADAADQERTVEYDEDEYR
jgi:hypothetical protein